MSGSNSNSQSEILGHNNQKSNSLFNIPGLFVGRSNKGLSDYDSVWSPTSPLDFRVFSNIGNPLPKSPRSAQNSYQKGWRSCKVGLSIVDSLDDDAKLSGKVMRSSESKNIHFGPGMRINNPRYQNHVEPFGNPKSLHKDYPVFPPTLSKTPLQKEDSTVVFEIGDSSLDPQQFCTIRSRSADYCRPFPAHSSLTARKTSFSVGNFRLASPVASSCKLINEDPNLNTFSLKPSLGSPGSSNGFLESLSASEIELSEDYTCVISHGPTPKTTRIYGDRILESLENDSFSSLNNKEEKPFAKLATVYASDNFLSFCHSCNKKLEEGKDIYIYRGEEAFCSFECRSLEIMNDEEPEKAKPLKQSPRSDNDQELFENRVIFTT